MVGRSTARAGAGGVVVGLLVSVALVVAWKPEPPPVDGPAAAAELLEAWERSRLATYYVRSEVLRTNTRGNELPSVLEVAQRPPDVIRRQYGGVAGRIGDHPVTCPVDPQTQAAECGTGTEVLPPYEEEVADEVADLSGWVVDPPGGRAPYRVRTGGDGCFELRLRRLEPAPPYGNRSLFCFDEATGAMVRSEIERDEGTEVAEAVEVRAEVTDGDLAVVG